VRLQGPQSLAHCVELDESVDDEYQNQLVKECLVYDNNMPWKE